MQGFLSLWRGNGINLLRIYINLMINKYMYRDSYMSAILSSFIATSFTHPLDVLRIKLSCDFSGRYENKLYTSMFDCLKKIIKHEGIKGLYKG